MKGLKSWWSSTGLYPKTFSARKPTLRSDKEFVVDKSLIPWLHTIALPRMQENVLSKADSQAKIVALPSGRTSPTGPMGPMTREYCWSSEAAAISVRIGKFTPTPPRQADVTWTYTSGKLRQWESNHIKLLRRPHQVAVRPKNVTSLNPSKSSAEASLMRHLSAETPCSRRRPGRLHSLTHSQIITHQDICEKFQGEATFRRVDHEGQICNWDAAPKHSSAGKQKLQRSKTPTTKIYKAHAKLWETNRLMLFGEPTWQRSGQSKGDHEVDSGAQADLQSSLHQIKSITISVSFSLWKHDGWRLLHGCVALVILHVYSPGSFCSFFAVTAVWRVIERTRDYSLQRSASWKSLKRFAARPKTPVFKEKYARGVLNVSENKRFREKCFESLTSLMNHYKKCKQLRLIFPGHLQRNCKRSETTVKVHAFSLCQVDMITF